jgi:mycothiol system anti-sigma-R factor
MSIPDCGPECQETLEKIERYLDGEVDESVHVRIEHHLAGCTTCAERAEFRRHLKIMVSSKCAEHHAPADLHVRIRALIRTLDRPTS